MSEAFPGQSLDGDLLISYGGEYLRFLARTLRFAEELAHGGTIIVLRDAEAVNAGKLLTIKYETANLQVWDDLVKSLRLIYDEIERSKAIGGQLPIDRNSFNDWRQADRELRKMVQHLIDRSRSLAELTQVDGALAMTDRFQVLGFGAVIEDLSKTPEFVRSCKDEQGLRFDETSTESFGTRHRSAMRLCLGMDCVAFVLSQDGGVKALKRVDEKVLLWPSVSLKPSAWVLTVKDLIPQERERYLNRNL